MPCLEQPPFGIKLIKGSTPLEDSEFFLQIFGAIFDTCWASFGDYYSM